MSSGWSCAAGTVSIPAPAVILRAVISPRVERRASAWAFPRPSAMASAKFAKITVSQSHAAIAPVNRRSSVRPRTRSARKIAVVMALPTSTTNITGFLSWIRGSSFLTDALRAVATMSAEKIPRRVRTAVIGVEDR